MINLNISNKWLWPEDDSPVFYKHFYQKVTWQEAQSVCEYNRAKLVTVDTSVQYDQVRAYLKELDVNNLVWIGLQKEASRFAWRDAKPLEGEGYWLESPPKEPESLCVALDPWKDYRWKTFNCAGPETATFICELPIPEWADHGYTGCMLDSLPSLTITYHPEDESVHLLHDCGLDGSRTVACKGTTDKRDLMMLLHCNQNMSTWYKGMWDSAISNRHRRSSTLPGEFTTPTHFVFANDLFDYDEEKEKKQKTSTTTADSIDAMDDNANSISNGEIANISDPTSKGDNDDSAMKDNVAPQDFMVGFAPEDLSFADEPIKSLPLGNFPVIPENDFEKPAVDGNIVYNSSTTETLSKLTVGTETQLVRSINNTSNSGKSETSTLSLEPITSTAMTSTSSKELKAMLVSGFEDTAKSLEKTAKKTGSLVEDTVKSLGSTFESTKGKIGDSIKSLKEKTEKLKINEDSEEKTESVFSPKPALKQVVGESLTLQKEGGESKIQEKVNNFESKINKDIDFLEKGANKSETDKHAQNYVNSGVQNLLDNTEKKFSESKGFIKEKSKLELSTTKTHPVQKMDKATQTEPQLTENFTEKTKTIASTTPGSFKTSVLKAIQDAKEKSVESLEEIDESIKTLYDKIIPTVKISTDMTTKKTETSTKPLPPTTDDDHVSTMKPSTETKQADVVLNSTPVSVDHLTEHNKRQEQSPGLVILDSKGHSLNSNQFESHSEDERTEETSTEFVRTTENLLALKPLFENEITVSKKNAVPSSPKDLTNQSGNQTVSGNTQQTGRSQGTSTTAKYERRNLPPVLMIDKVEQFNEAAGAGKNDPTTTVMTESTIAKEGAAAESTTTITTVRSESQTIKKTLPAILGNKQPFVPTTVKPSSNSVQSSSTISHVTTKRLVEPVPDLPEKPKRSPLFSQQQHRSHYPYFLGRILG
ncbi:hypothetical protein M8J76_013942 [Diaphorina citri]|nr:hypothetical protein M8J76_013942 [Diaphorina citri]